MALPTNGRVIITTTVGDLDIELWSKETPKACRNFLALAMEGYYDGVIFHRVVPGFLVQTGDRTGTGAGGESFYGEPFEDEIHPRLRFAHRGLVGMANNGTKNSNDSQFFITLDRADELHGKHTLFGRCIGDTVYNAMKIGELELGENERPLYPPKIKSIRIMDNPFPDIIPRITAAERRAQQRAQEESRREREEEAKRKGAKKNTKLLSFGADEGEEGEPVSVPKKKDIVRPDLVRDSTTPSIADLPDFVTQPSTSSKPPPPPPQKAPEEEDNEKTKSKTKSKQLTAEDLAAIRKKHAEEKAAGSNARQIEIAKMEAEIKKISRTRGGGGSDSEYDSDGNRKRKKQKRSYLQEELSKYSSSRGTIANRKRKGRKGDTGDDDILATLSSFRGKLKQSYFPNSDSGPAAAEGERDEDAAAKDDGLRDGLGWVKEQNVFEEDPGMEVDDDTDFLGHALHFPKDNTEEVQKAQRDYEVIDPRKRGAQAREEERQRKKESRRVDGGRGFNARR